MRCQSLRFRQPTELVDFSLQCDWCRNIGRSSRQKEERQVPVFFLGGGCSLFSLFTGPLPLERRLDVAFFQFSSRTAILPTPTFWNCPASHFFDKDPLAWLTSNHITSSSRGRFRGRDCPTSSVLAKSFHLPNAQCTKLVTFFSSLTVL